MKPEIVIKILFLCSFQPLTFIDANRSWGWRGGGGNNRWKQNGSSHNNNWRQTNHNNFGHNQNKFWQNNHNFQQNNSDQETRNNYGGQHTNNNQRPNHNSWWQSTDSQPQVDNTKPETNPEVPPQISFSQLLSDTSCEVPTMGDSSKFQLRCVSPDATEGDCSELGQVVPSGTTTLLKCKAPYYSETGEMRIWVCEEGRWKGEFTAFRCSYTTYTQSSDSNPYRTNNTSANQINNNYYNQPSYPWNNVPTQPAVVEHPKSTPAPNNVVNGLFPDLVDDEITTQTDDSEKTPNQPYPSWKPYKTTIQPATTPPKSVPPPFAKPPWAPIIEQWEKPTMPTTTPTTTTPSTTTTRTTTTTPATTTTTTTPRPYIPAPTTAQSFEDQWSSYMAEKTKENATSKCPSLSKGSGIQLDCLSKTPVPWDPSSFIVSQSDCKTPQPLGTEATYKCQQYFEASAGLTLQYRKCKEDGTWTGGENGFSCSLECGRGNPVGKIPLITNGEPTYKAQWPWHAALFFRDMQVDPIHHAYICGATLITKRALLTAAHCVTEFFSNTLKSMSEFRIDLGRYHRAVDDEFVQTFTVDDIIPHPSYNPYIYDSDIAIIILKTAVTVGFSVRPICYPQTQNSAFESLHLSDGSVGTVVGFGKNENNELADTLQMARLKVINQQECAESFSDTASGAALTKSTTFCAGLKNGTNVCSGDSGGGIYFPLNSGGTSRWYLQGLVSVGIGSQDGAKRCDPTRNSIFTRISPYADWVLRVLSENNAL